MSGAGKAEWMQLSLMEERARMLLGGDVARGACPRCGVVLRKKPEYWYCPECGYGRTETGKRKQAVGCPRTGGEEAGV